MSETDQKVVQLETLRKAEAPATGITPEILAQIIDETERRVAARASRPSPFNLRTFEEIESFAERVVKSNLCPKDYKGRPDDAVIAVMKGNEVGLPPMASLESIAVINGRPCIWGDAVPGICMATGQVQDVVERFDGEEGSDDYAAVCIVTRRGMTPREGRFSYGDVRRAGIKSVHLTYPKDMVMWRARHRAWHGAFPDTLKGLGTAEIESEDNTLPAWPLPRPERKWMEPRTGKPGDDWDPAWVNDLVMRLAETTTAWQWMETLINHLEAAPTLRDVDEVDALPGVVANTETAPEEAKTTIQNAFAAARARLAKPESTDQPDPNNQAERQPPKTETPAATIVRGDASGTPTFDAYLQDESGEPVGDEPYSDPVLWAEGFLNAYERSGNRLGLVEQNADAIADARTYPEAAEMLAEIRGGDDDGASSTRDAAGAGQGTEAPAVDPHLIPAPEGRSSWGEYLRAFRAMLAKTTPETVLDFIVANRQTLMGAPAQSTKTAACSAIVSHCTTLGVPVPAGLEDTLDPRAKARRGNAGAAQQQTAETAAQPSQQAATPAPSDGDAKLAKDTGTADDLIATAQKMASHHEIRTYGQGPAVQAVLNRFKRTAEAGTPGYRELHDRLLTSINKAFTDKGGVLPGGATSS